MSDKFDRFENNIERVNNLNELFKIVKSTHNRHTVKEADILRASVELLGLWEQLNNPNFKHLEFEVFRNAAGANAFTLAAKKWIESMNAVGIISKYGKTETSL